MTALLKPEARAWIFVDWPDINYTVRWARVSDHWMDFELFSRLGVFEENGLSRIAWNRKDAPCRPDPVYSLDEAQVTIAGHVKWDGCWEFHQVDEVLHFCGGRDGLREFSEALERVLRLAIENLPAADPEMFEEQPRQGAPRGLSSVP